MKWIEALKLWNKQHNPGKWCVAKKGSKEYEEVQKIMKGEKVFVPKQKMEEIREKAIEKGKKQKDIRERFQKATATKRIEKAILKAVQEKRSAKGKDDSEAKALSFNKKRLEEDVISWITKEDFDSVRRIVWNWSQGGRIEVEDFPGYIRARVGMIVPKTLLAGDISIGYDLNIHVYPHRDYRLSYDAKKAEEIYNKREGELKAAKQKKKEEKKTTTFTSLDDMTVEQLRSKIKKLNKEAKEIGKQKKEKYTVLKGFMNASKESILNYIKEENLEQKILSL